MGFSRAGVVCVAASVLVIGFAAGFLVGYIGLKGDNQIFETLSKDGDDSITEKILSSINAENIRNNLRKLTSKPHLAGTPADFEQADHLRTLWQSQGLKSWLASYDVLLTYPDTETEPSRIELQDGSGSILFTSQLFEKILHQDQNQSDVVPPYNCYSPSGKPKGQLVYVNYGRIEDFLWLKEEKNMDFEGKICIARYGKIFRGDKAANAEKFGAAGLIMYTDPKDYAVENLDSVYPDSWWIPETGVQRGSLKLEGDLLTPGYPAIESAFRVNESEAGLPKIPIHPISYGDALKFLENMAGEDAPDNWQGDLPITYKLGPGFQDEDWVVEMKINSVKKRVTTYNAFGMIEGAIEPDRYVLLGNHRDAWVFGAVDPSSGTASMMELSRVLGKLVQEGWKPRRSIIFCSWGAEEQGLIGSKEWVEQHTSVLSDRAVAYINVDISVQGNFTFRANGLPMIKDALYDISKKIPNPDPDERASGRTSVYDTWKLRYPEVDDNNTRTGYPKIGILGSGSDYEAFISKVGVTCVDLRYHFDESLGISSYPLYHSVYETFHLVNDIMDPEFKYHKTVTQFWGELARKLADDYILPYNTNKYVDALEHFQKSLLSKHGKLIADNGLQKSLDYLSEAIKTMRVSAENFQKRLKSVNKDNPIEVRTLNDQLLRLERTFIDPQGLPGRPYTRNIVFAPSMHNSYSGSSFPGIVDSLFGIDKMPVEEAREQWRAVDKQISVVTYHIQAAAAVLRDWTEFKY